jgi:Transglutaminase-like superfamily
MGLGELVEFRARFGLNESMRRLAWCVALVCTSSALAAQPVLHEFFQLDGDAELPPSPLSPPRGEFPLDVDAPATPIDDPAIAAGAVPQDEDTSNRRPEQPTADDEYRLDGNTSQPDQVGYSDPFTPSIPPFKRLFAYDAVNEALELVVAKSALRPVHVGGVARSSQDQFMGKQSLVLASNGLVRLPTVGPGVRVLNARLTPGADFHLFQDSAENLFIKAETNGAFEWVVHLALERATLGSPFADVTWPALQPFVPELPDIVNEAALPVLARLELTNAPKPAVAVRRMVEYFRSFAPKDEQRSEKGLQLYREIALSQKGVCRHRAFAFVVTGLALGLPSRFVRNEAHAWVEVYDGRIWHRLDLGGAAGEMALTSDLDVPHEAPPDPYTWPPKSESGENMVDRALQAAMASAGGDGANGGGRSGGAAKPGVTPGPASQPSADAPTPSASGAPPPVPSLVPEETAPTEAPTQGEPPPPTRLTVTFGGAQLKRGERFSVQGTARNAKGEACSLMRIDVVLFDSGSRSTFSAGTLVTDQQGKYAGQLVLPQRVPVGDYQVRASSPGHQTCAASD